MFDSVTPRQRSTELDSTSLEEPIGSKTAMPDTVMPDTVIQAPVAPHWSPPLQNVLDQPASSLPLRLAVAGLGFSAAFSAWAWIGQVNEVAHAQGKLVPRGEPYKIHPVDMGKVTELLVKEGQVVKPGQVLAKLDTELVSQEVTRLEKRFEDQKTELRQLQEFLERSQVQADARRAVSQAGIRAQRIELTQAHSTAVTSQEMLAQLQSDASAQTERLNRLKPLQEEGAIPVEQVFQVEQSLRDRNRTILESQGNLQKSISTAQRLQEEIAQQKADADRVEQDAQQQVQQAKLQITDLRSKMNETQALIASAQAKLKQGDLQSPINGTISLLNVRNIGEVVQPGQTVAEILPAGKPLTLSAIVPNREAGLIKQGMSVQVKLDAYPYQDYGMIAGKVLTIAPDSQANQQGESGYRVDIELDRAHVMRNNQKVSFKAGQTASAEIVTRRRRIIDLLIDPLKQLQGEINL